ncbi:MAG: response regulator transcription factor [Geminicoccaceae bacterium]
MAEIRVFLADDHPMILAGIRALLAAESDIEVVGEASDGRTALARATTLQPDIAVLDLSMPGLSGIEVVRALASASPNCRCIILSVHDDRVYVRRILDEGAAGYVVKRSATTELVRAIRSVAAGGLYLDPAVAAQAVEHATQGSVLSDRERDVLRLSLTGHSNKSIANLMGIAVRTVEAHKARAITKLGVQDRVDQMRYAADQGWLSSKEL